MRVVIDSEGTHLLNSESIDYTASPYKLKDEFRIHCICVTDIDTRKEYDFTPDNIWEFPEFAKQFTQIVAHNGISYDYLAFKLFFGMDFTVGPDTLMGKPVKIEDSLVLSKVLNPDRFGNHGIADWGKRFKYPKINWRKEAIELGLITKDCPKGAEFKVYHPKMLEYCRTDVTIGLLTWEALLEEWGDWDWEEAYQLEKAVSEIVSVRQEHRGFWFDEDKAHRAVTDLDQKLKEIADLVEPLIPEKPLTQAEAKLYSFPAKPFKKDGSVSANMLKWITKQDAKALYEDDEFTGVEWLGKTWEAPFPKGSVVETLPATLKGSTHIKEWLVSLGWVPTSWKENDLTVDAKKVKLTREKFEAAIERYVEKTLNSQFRYFRCEYLSIEPEKLRSKLLNHDMKKPLRVITNPSFTIGQDKELCHDLLRLDKKFPYAKEVVNWLTFSHRRSSILGGGVSLDDSEEDAKKGYLSQDRIRQDHRISTPADTCGAATSRFTHRVVANVPRVSSPYGRELRELFGCDPETSYQIGYDADSLEAKVTSHYIMKYNGKDLAKELVAGKPYDVHSLNAKRLKITRDEAKTFFYAVLYGAQPGTLAKQLGWPVGKARRIFNEFWATSKPIADLKDKLIAYWKANGRKYILGIDGRKVPTRSEHALLNSLFQSCGLIAMKRAMVIHDRALKEEGLLVDFFRDDWKNSSYVQQMIAYHK